MTVARAGIAIAKNSSAPIANGVTRRMEAFVSLCRRDVERKRRNNRVRKAILGDHR
jgi:hypothetical protein